MSHQRIGVLLLFVLFCAACFGIDRKGGIIKYREGTVFTALERFQVPSLPNGWKKPKIRLKQLVYENDLLGATLVVDALCGPKFDESPLPRLARDLFDRLQDVQLEKEKFLTLQGRQALELEGRGSLDGVPFGMKVVVMKRDFCLYDFVYFASPSHYREGKKTFEDFIHGTKFR